MADSISPVQCLLFVRVGVAGPQLSSTVRQRPISMPLDPVKIERRERQLLAHESAYRVMRYIFVRAVIALLALEFIGVPYLQARGTATDFDHRAPLLTIVFLFLVCIFAHAKVHHAESVRFHHERRQFGHCPKCGYNLEGNVDQGCPECGWRRAR